LVCKSESFLGSRPRFTQCQKGINRGSVTPQKRIRLAGSNLAFSANVKRFRPLGLKGSTQEKWTSEIFRFGYRKAANDLADAGVPDPRRLRIYFLSLRGELREIVNVEALLDPGHFVHDLFKSVLSEEFVFFLFEIFA
jgi:hypothetical protein